MEKENPYKIYKKPLVAVLGNPLYEVFIPLPSLDEVKKCNIEGKKLLDDPDFSTLYERVKKRDDLSTWPGGSGQTTAQMMQWIIGEPGYVVMFGSIGADKTGETMQRLVSQNGIIPKYIYDKTRRTGVCLTFHSGKEKATVANLGAAVLPLGPERIFTDDIRALLKTVHLAYLEGYFISNGYLAAMELLNICKLSGIFLSFNLNAVEVVNDHPDNVLHFITNCDFVFGNKIEYQALATAHNWEVESPRDIIKAIMKRCHVRPDKYKRQSLPELFHRIPLIVVTDGARPITIGHGISRPIEEYNVIPLSPDQILDDTGAGDGFVGGFLAAVALGLEIQHCVRWGCETAIVIMKQIGVRVPTERPVWTKNVVSNIRPRRTSI